MSAAPHLHAQVTILTGRPHQIRIHMAALGHPLVGDPLYGPGGMPLVSGQLLAARGVEQLLPSRWCKAGVCASVCSVAGMLVCMLCSISAREPEPER